MVDAGFSSEIVGAALVRVTKAYIALAQVGEGIADKVHAAKGSYDDIENTNAGRIRYDSEKSEATMEPLDQIDRERQQSEAAYPFEDAPTQSGSQPELKARRTWDYT